MTVGSGPGAHHEPAPAHHEPDTSGSRRTERIGVLGGTFDPVHFGHMAAAVSAHEEAHLDRVLMVVAPRPWQKSGRVAAPAEDRMAMVEAAVSGCDWLEASRIEIDRSGDTFTVDTLEELSAPGRTLFLIVGADVAGDLGSWHRGEEVAALCELLVVGRPGVVDPPVDPMWAMTPIPSPAVDVSSSEIRRRWAAGMPVDHLVPQEVIAVMRSRGLYAETMKRPAGDR